MKKNINYLDIFEKSEGKVRQIEFLKEPLNGGTFLPKTLLLEDIDKSFKEWASSLEIISDDGKAFPTMSLYSNQRFSEYMQSWQYTDANNNLLLNFKTITRNNNPNFGEIQSKNYNIPSDIFFHMKSSVVLDDNGSESLLKLKMKQPTALDLTYKLCIFTTNFKHLNTFNVLVNRMFNSRQVYINPNGYYMPMTLESINDESQYNIDDRQFFSQTYDIKVKAYIITEDDFRVEEVPLKNGVVIDNMQKNTSLNIVEIEDIETDNGEEIVKLTITLNSKSSNSVNFTMDSDLLVEEIKIDNLYNNLKIFIDGEKMGTKTPFNLKDKQVVKIFYKKIHPNKPSYINFLGKTI